MQKTYAIVTTQFEALHFYKNAPEGVSFLRYPHRHIFHVKVHIEELHNDRDIEFILFKRWLNKLINKYIVPLDNVKSCEMMCEELYIHIRKKYKKQSIKIEITEDGENGSLIEFE